MTALTTLLHHLGALPRKGEAPLAPPPFVDNPPEDREAKAARRQGLFLARQEDWDTLARLITETDANRVATPGGYSVAALMAEGASGDVTGLFDAMPGGAAVAEHGLAEMEAALAQDSASYGTALVAASARLAAARRWRTEADLPGQPGLRAREAAMSQLRRAHALLAPHHPLEHDSPSLAAARCAILAGQGEPASRIAEEHEDLIDLDPASPLHMRAMGRRLLPRRGGSLDLLEHSARATARRTADIWGEGGYVWCHLDTLPREPRAFGRLDLDRFRQGLRDIVMRHQDQHLVNLLAAWCAVTMAPPAAEPGNDASAARKRAALHEARHWLLGDHLREIHPLPWADAAPCAAQDVQDRKALGRARAEATLGIAPPSGEKAPSPALTAGRRRLPPFRRRPAG